MSTHIHVSDESLKRCAAAPCSKYRNTVISYTIAYDPCANSQEICARIDKPGVLQLPFTNSPPKTPTTLSEDCYAIHYQMANMSRYNDPRGETGLMVTERTKYVFLSFLSRTEFVDKNKQAKNGYLGNQWEEMRFRHMGLYVEFDNSKNKQICASCSIKPSNQPDCSPQLVCVAYPQFKAAICMTAIRMIRGDESGRGKYDFAIRALHLDRKELDDAYDASCGREQVNWLNEYIEPAELQAPPSLMPPEVFMRRLMMAIFKRKIPFKQSEIPQFIHGLEIIRYFASQLKSDDEYFAMFIESWVDNLDSLLGILHMCRANHLEMEILF